jgi:hypothetical protein
MSEWKVDLTGQFIQRLPKMYSEILAFWIKTLGLVELPESGINPGVP